MSNSINMGPAPFPPSNNDHSHDAENTPIDQAAAADPEALADPAAAAPKAKGEEQPGVAGRDPKRPISLNIPNFNKKTFFKLIATEEGPSKPDAPYENRNFEGVEPNSPIESLINSILREKAPQNYGEPPQKISQPEVVNVKTFQAKLGHMGILLTVKVEVNGKAFFVDVPQETLANVEGHVQLLNPWPNDKQIIPLYSLKGGSSQWLIDHKKDFKKYHTVGIKFKNWIQKKGSGYSEKNTYNMLSMAYDQLKGELDGIDAKPGLKAKEKMEQKKVFTDQLSDIDADLTKMRMSHKTALNAHIKVAKGLFSLTLRQFEILNDQSDKTTQEQRDLAIEYFDSTQARHIEFSGSTVKLIDPNTDKNSTEARTNKFSIELIRNLRKGDAKLIDDHSNLSLVSDSKTYSLDPEKLDADGSIDMKKIAIIDRKQLTQALLEKEAKLKNLAKQLEDSDSIIRSQIDNHNLTTDALKNALSKVNSEIEELKKAGKNQESQKKILTIEKNGINSQISKLEKEQADKDNSEEIKKKKEALSKKESEIEAIENNKKKNEEKIAAKIKLIKNLKTQPELIKSFKECFDSLKNVGLPALYEKINYEKAPKDKKTLISEMKNPKESKSLTAQTIARTLDKLSGHINEDGTLKDPLPLPG